MHPAIKEIVLKFAKVRGVDVTDIALMLCGGSFGDTKSMKAFRIIAAQALKELTSEGILTQHGAFESKTCPEKGGPWFTVANLG